MENLYKVLIASKRMLLLFTLFLAPHFIMQAQNISVTGTVTSAEDKLGVPGVNVVIKGTTNATTTDFDGNYTISVPSGTVLVFSSVGFKTQEITVTGTTLNVTLESDTKQLEEVVVVGYGAQRKEAVTGSVVSIKGEQLREMPAANITQALQGRLAGVELAQTSTKPGATMQIRIRGTRSLNASNDPLVVLDGIPFAGSLSDLSSDDIKSIEILKDASATAIYGSRGANGVILVTSNKGQKGGEAHFTYNGYFGTKEVFSYYPMMNGPKYAKLRTAAGMYTNGLDEADDVNTNWQDLFYRTGTMQNHYMGVSGGTPKGSYNFSTSYYKEEAVIPLQDYQRVTLQGSLDQEIGLFRFGFTSNNNYSINNGNSLNMYGVLSMSPLANPYNEDGSWKRTVRMPLDEQWVYSKYTLEHLGDKYVDKTKAFSSYNTLYGEVKIPWVDGLKFRTNLGGTVRTSNSGSYTGEGVFSTTADTPSVASIGNSLTTNWTIENLLTYDHTFSEKHKVNAVALYSAQENMYNSSSISAKNIPSDAFQFYNLGQAQGEVTINPANQAYQKSGLLSYMGRVMYSYNDKYMLSATMRSDASSRLAPGHQWHTYPAVSAGWNIKGESFLKESKTIDLLKLRVGYGETSNQSVDPYKTLGLLSTRPYNFGGTYSTGYYVSQLPNPKLGWEYSKTWNYGVDFGFFNSRITGTVEYYVQDTNNVLLSVGLPATSGVSSYTANIGATQNKGFELTLNGLIIDNPDGFSWDAGINLYANRNKLVSLASGATRDESNWWFVGHPINVIYDYQRVGLWQEGDPYIAILEPGAANDPTVDNGLGMIKVKYTGEYNDDGTPVRAIGTDDRQIMDVNPKYQGGFNTHFNYKGFDLGIVGAFQNGGILISTLYGSAGYLNLMDGRRGQVDVDYWTPDHTNTRYPNPKSQRSSNNPKYGSTLGYFDGSYVKIRTISLGYTFKQDFLKRNGVQKLRLYSTLQNPWVIYSPYHKATGMDPETNSYGDENSAVSSYQRRLLTQGVNTPVTRNLMIGMNITF
ncbi:SusC/RagA family TonB-linked outer membrane protein [Flavobacterium sp. RHBU_3]|uniref:SusC/RagA family TonB-linked outer membrane protein n=1 Tax=Flavobacterium sp. RHBU_3 TaxID=3391184 RepID=UPI00398507DE